MKKTEKELNEFVNQAEKINRQNRESANRLLAAEGKIWEERRTKGGIVEFVRGIYRNNGARAAWVWK